MIKLPMDRRRCRLDLADVLALVDLADLAEDLGELQLTDLDPGVHPSRMGHRDLQGPGPAEPDVAVAGR